MMEMAPCKDCPDRHTACHGSCDKYKQWKERHTAQQQHLKETGNRFSTLMTESRKKAYSKPGVGKYNIWGKSYE